MHARFALTLPSDVTLLQEPLALFDECMALTLLSTEQGAFGAARRAFGIPAKPTDSHGFAGRLSIEVTGAVPADRIAAIGLLSGLGDVAVWGGPLGCTTLLLEALAGRPAASLTSLSFRSGMLAARHVDMLLPLTALRRLDLRGSTIGAEGAARLAGGLRALTDLDLGNNSIGNRGVAAIVAELPALTRLDVSYNNIDDSGFSAVAHLPELRDLRVSWNNHGNRTYTHALPACVRLERLDLAFCVTPPPLAAFLGAMPRLAWLDVSNSGVSSKHAFALTQLKHLARLDVSVNAIDAHGARVISGIETLTDLDISWNNVCHLGATHLTLLTRLSKLDIGSNAVLDCGAMELACMPSLLYLDVRRNRLSAGGAAWLRGARRADLTLRM